MTTDKTTAGIALKALLEARPWIYAVGIKGQEIVVYSSQAAIPSWERSLVPPKWMGFKVRVERAGSGLPVQIAD